MLLDHKKNSCSGRSVSCKYCELKLLFHQLWDHEKSCGSVTEVCEKCKNRFPRRGACYFFFSNVHFHYLELPYHESACDGSYSRPYRRRSEGRDLMVCEKCQAPFQAFDELQVCSFHFVSTHFQVHVLTVHSDEVEKFSLFGGSGFADENGVDSETAANETPVGEESEKEEEEKLEAGLFDEMKNE